MEQLDNYTDWEYEQLDDGPSLSAASHVTIAPIFSMNMNSSGNSGGANQSGESQSLASQARRINTQENTRQQ
jgi:hypothetical protein